MNQQIPSAVSDQALQALYRDMIDACITTAPAAFQPAMQEIQARIDDAYALTEQHVQAFEVLCEMFKSFKPSVEDTTQ